MKRFPGRWWSMPLSAALLFFTTAAFATNGYQLIGVGGYQMGMAGAVVANPGSAMTAISNPAGLAFIQPQADFSIEGFSPERHVRLQQGAPNEKSETPFYGVPSLGWGAPIHDHSNIYFGGGMYATSGLGTDYLFPAGNGMTFQGYSQVSLLQMAPAVAVRLNPQLSLGASLNVGYESLGFKQGFINDSTGGAVVGNPAMGYPPAYVDLSQSASAFGVGATFGVIYRINPMVTIGASYRTKQTFGKLKYYAASGQIQAYNPMNNSVMVFPAGEYTTELDVPQQFAVGVTVHPVPALDISPEVKWIDWSSTMGNFVVTPPSGSGYPSLNLKPGWENQVVYALGIQYRVTPRLTIRGGFNYAKSPVRSSTVTNNFIFPAVVEDHYTIGFSYDLNNHWEVGAAYMYAPKKTYTAPLSQGGGSVDLQESAAVFNLGYHF